MFESSSVTNELVTETWTAPDGKRCTRRLEEWNLIDRRLRSYANQRAALDAAESFDLVRAADLKIHFSYGHATFIEYMEHRLGYVPHTARERMRVARGLVTLPVTAAALSRGELTYSHVRELTRVATPDTEEAWLAAAADRTSGEVQELASLHAYGDLPTDPERPNLRPKVLRLELPTEVYALWREARRSLSEERGGEVSDADLMETLCRRQLDPGTGAERPAHQIAFQQCPDCKRAKVNGAGRAIDVQPEVLERAACDARWLGDLEAKQPERATTSVTPRMREQIFARDGFRCCVPGCRSTRNLDIHHLIAQSQGGPHALWNCICLCSGHHRALHAGLLTITGRAPFELVFRWTFCRPLPAGATGPIRQAVIEEAVEKIFGPLEPAELIPVRLSSIRKLRAIEVTAHHVPAGTSLEPTG
jgi:hypothetical protein